MAIKAKPVIQCQLTGEYIKYHKSIYAAERRTGVIRQEIIDVLKFRKPFDKNMHTWLYYDEDSKRLVPEGEIKQKRNKKDKK